MTHPKDQEVWNNAADTAPVNLSHQITPSATAPGAEDSPTAISTPDSENGWWKWLLGILGFLLLTWIVWSLIGGDTDGEFATASTDAASVAAEKVGPSASRPLLPETEQTIP
ncbi:hypothetical protein [Corynebacterium mayonis]|uniref:hypothetical protein n=1 Tax=Corynebacterium mayonis TaxID=3062461 RepID=UPI0031408AE5